MGQLEENTTIEEPLVLFNKKLFAVYEYDTKAAIPSFVKLELNDEENLAHKIPSSFCSIYLGNEAYLLGGGYESVKNKTSK